jgi:hypothetical protein
MTSKDHLPIINSSINLEVRSSSATRIFMTFSELLIICTFLFFTIPATGSAKSTSVLPGGKGTKSPGHDFYRTAVFSKLDSANRQYRKM